MTIFGIDITKNDLIRVRINRAGKEVKIINLKIILFQLAPFLQILPKNISI